MDAPDLNHLMVLLLELFAANKIPLGFNSMSGFLSFPSQLISRGVGLGQNVVFLTRDPWRRVKLLEK